MGDGQAHDRPLRFDIEGDAGVLGLVIGFKGTNPRQNEAPRGGAFENLPDYVDGAGAISSAVLPVRTRLPIRNVVVEPILTCGLTSDR